MLRKLMMKKRKYIPLLTITSLLLGGAFVQTKSYAQDTFTNPLVQNGPVSFPTLGKVSSQPTDANALTPDVPTKKEEGKTVLQVETKVTDDEVSDLTKKTYNAQDSLIKPVIAASTMSQSQNSDTPSSSSKSLSLGLQGLFEGKVNAATIHQASSNPSSEITIPAASISVQDGTASFDADNNPGHDASANNGIVRSWDTITYLAAFSIQNTNLNKNYTNIRYRVTSHLSNAVTLQSDGKTPQVNASIVNGMMYNQDGTAYTSGNRGYSEGIMESTISNTGQVFVPISVAVQGAPNGLTLQPTFKIEIVDAIDKETGGTVTFNNSYDTSDFAALTPPKETVSATPSVTVKLVKGDVLNGANASAILNNNYGKGDEYAYLWDVGGVVSLQPISGRNTGDFRGSAYPTGPVNYTLSMWGSYTDSGGNTQNMVAGDQQTYEITVQGVSGATYGRTSSWVSTTGGFQTGVSASDINKYLTTPLSVPNAYTGAIYNGEPSSDQNKIGVYNSGTVSGTNSGGAGTYGTATINNINYSPIFNPYTYSMLGDAWDTSNSRPFSSIEMLIRYDGTRTKSLADQNNWSRSDMHLYVQSVSYNGITVNSPNDIGDDRDLVYSSFYTPSGDRSGSASIYSQRGDASNIEPNVVNKNPWDGNPVADIWGSGVGNSIPSVTKLDGGGGWLDNTGNAQLNVGQKIQLINSIYSNAVGDRGVDLLTMWDPSAFTFDKDGLVASSWPHESNRYASMIFRYGVAKSLNNSPTHTLKVSGYSNDYNLYNWYTRADINNGVVKIEDISAMSSKRMYPRDALEMPGGGVDFMGAPVIVKQKQAGSVTPNGNRTVVLTDKRFLNASGNQTYDPVINSPSDNRVNSGNYLPSQPQTYVTNPTFTPMVYWNWIGETVYVKPYSITTKTSVDKTTYDVKDPINITLKTLTNGSPTDNYWGTLKSTLPVGIKYTPGTAKDAQGRTLPEPQLSTTGSGTTLQQVLTWTWGTDDNGEILNNIDVTKGFEVHIGASSDLGSIFNNPGFSNQGITKSPLVVNTIATMQNSGSSDPSADVSRSSADQFNEHLIQQLILSKTGDKPTIEVGNVDPANSKSASSNDITYTVTALNNSAQEVSNLSLLDVLPYNGDSRGTKYSGNYSVTNVKATVTNSDGSMGTAPVLSFSTQKPSASGINEKTDSNTSINGTVVSGSTDYSKATMFQVKTPTSVSIGATVTLTVTLRPDNTQKANDIYSNTAGMDSSIVQPVFSQRVSTKVYGRDLSGFAWVDKNKDGLFNNNEDPAKNIPVKLYRTSLSNTDYKDKLVTADMQGNKFVTASGDSTVITDSNGKYTFDNLPEGAYVAEFQIGDLIHRQTFMVTAENVGSDLSINSKTDAQTYRTTNYQVSLPNITGLPSVSDNNGMAHMKYLNLGLTPPPDTVLPYTGANKIIQTLLIIASVLTIFGLIIFLIKYLKKPQHLS